MASKQPPVIRLFIKRGCPWCDEASEWLDAHSLAYETLDVSRDEEAWDEMEELSGQTMAPVIEVNGHVLADFGADELSAWWTRMGFPT